jgi:hypothetical protein
MNTLNFSTWAESLTTFTKRILNSDAEIPEAMDCAKYLYALYRRHFSGDNKRHLFSSEIDSYLEEMLEIYDHPVNRGEDGKAMFSLKNAEGFLIVLNASMTVFINTELRDGKLNNEGFVTLLSRMLSGRRLELSAA